ncbi:MAG: division/cell wall cluster transcriptional repressor MraZ [Candidatus Abyssubacteria bacterium]
MIFTGNYRYSLDDKNRLIIPSKFREILMADGVDRLYMVNDRTHLSVYPLKVFQEICNKMDSWEFTEETKQNYIRLRLSDAFDVTIDKQGRILLRKEQCEEIGIEREVVIIGVLNRMEIWPPDKWQEFRERTSLREVVSALSEHSQGK